MLKILGYKQGTKIKNDSKFPLCSYKEFGANSKFGVFLKVIAPAGTKKIEWIFEQFYANF